MLRNMNLGSSINYLSSLTVSTTILNSIFQYFEFSLIFFFYISGYVTCILDDAKVYANHAKKKVIELDDVKLACQMTLEKAFTAPPPREVSVQSKFFLLNSNENLLIYYFAGFIGIGKEPKRNTIARNKNTLRFTFATRTALSIVSQLQIACF